MILLVFYLLLIALDYICR